MADPSQEVVFVTGATSGIGAGVARRFIREGARVVATGRRADRLDALKSELGDRLHTVELDIRDRNAVSAAVSSLPTEYAAVSVLVNNAGLSLGGASLDKLDLDDADTMIDTNIKGVVYTTRAILPGMLERNRGHIFNIGSVGGVYPAPGNTIYGSSKSFVHMFNANLRADIVGSRVRVTILEPGSVDTEFFQVKAHGDPAPAEAFKKNTRIISTDEFADILFFAYSLPAHVNTNIIEIMPTDQGWNRYAVHRE
jgi:3-hydroxy acid dehydrogenase/malonic semialdehyde reductase